MDVAIGRPQLERIVYTQARTIPRCPEWSVGARFRHFSSVVVRSDPRSPARNAVTHAVSPVMLIVAAGCALAKFNRIPVTPALGSLSAMRRGPPHTHVARLRRRRRCPYSPPRPLLQRQLAATLRAARDEHLLRGAPSGDAHGQADRRRLPSVMARRAVASHPVTTHGRHLAARRVGPDRRPSRRPHDRRFRCVRRP